MIFFDMISPDEERDDFPIDYSCFRHARRLQYLHRQELDPRSLRLEET